MKNIVCMTDIIIGNYRMQRETPEDAWTITEVAQMSSVQAWPIIPLGRYGSKSHSNLWKKRLIKSTQVGLNIYTFLRFEYHIKIFYTLSMIIVLKFLAFLLSDVPTQ